MTFDLDAILASKRAYRRSLAARDIGEKLRILDALRKRAVALRPRSLPVAVPRPIMHHSTLYRRR